MSRLVVLLGLLAAVPTAVFADLEIVVTASRVEEEARSTPAYVRVIPHEVIERGYTVIDALRTLPDVAVQSTSPGNETVSMGGFGENGFGRTLILVDGRPVNRPDMASVNWRTIPADQVERIEVVKGPLSSQYGDQAVAGAINIITKDPEGFGAYARADITNTLTNRQAAGIGYGGEGFRIDGGFAREDLRPTRDRSDSRTTSATLDTGFTAGGLEADFGGVFSDGYYQLPGGLTEAEYESNPDQATNPGDEVKERTYGARGDISVDFGTGSIALPLSWRRVEGAFDFPSWWFSPSPYYDSLLDDLRGTLQADLELFAGDASVLVPVLGFDVAWSQIGIARYFDQSRTMPDTRGSAQRLDMGLWFRLKALLGERWVIDGGLRYSIYEITGGSDTARYTPFVYDVGASWLPSEYWAVSLRYGRVFRYPLLDEQASFYGLGPDGINTDLEPEFGHHVTGSVEFDRGRFGFAVAPYFIAMMNEIVYNPVTFQNENIGNTYHIGGVVSAAWSGTVLGIAASYSYDDARFADTGKAVPLVPLHTATGRVSVRPVRSLEISTDIRVSSEYTKGGDVENTQPNVPGRLDWGARVDWKPTGRITVYAQVRNILDERTPTLVYWSPFGESWYPTEGRVFDFGASWRY